MADDYYGDHDEDDVDMTAMVSGDDAEGKVISGDDSVLESNDDIAFEDDEIPQDDDANANGRQCTLSVTCVNRPGLIQSTQPSYDH